jgi:hypothetical protein
MRNSLVFLLMTAAWGQSPSESAAVEGTITHAVTGAPIARAHVSLRGAKAYGALTNPQGSFSITGLPQGAYEASVERIGFFLPATAQVVLRAGERKKDLDLKLAPLGAIAGRVLDERGEPVESARVSIDTGQGLSPTLRDTTDDKGEYSIVGLRPGRYRVLAVKGASIPGPPEFRSDGTSEVRLLPTYYPGVADYKSASRVDVRTGAQLSGIDIRLVSAPMVCISGMVIGSAPGPGGASVMFSQTIGPRGSARIKKDGTFEAWNIDPGKYFVHAVWSAGGQRMQTVPVELEIGFSNIENVELRRVPPSDVTGQIIFEDEQAKPPAGKARIELRTVDPGFNQNPVRSDLGEGGAFLLEGAGAARYRVMLGWDTAYVKAIKLGSDEKPGNVLNLRGGAMNAQMTVLVSSAFGEISGKVLDEGKARIALVRDDFVSAGDVTFLETDAAGAYRIERVRPGGYRIAVVDQYDMAPRAGVLVDYEDVLKKIEVKPKESLTVDLKR